MSITITNVDLGSVQLGGGVSRDEVFTAGGAATYVEGLILARNTASGKLVPWESGGTGGNEVPKAILTYDVTTAGAGDVQIRALVSGEVNKDRLLEWDGGTPTAANIDDVVLDQLRDYGLVPVDTAQLARVDNPQ
jgi:hypothetical protein